MCKPSYNWGFITMIILTLLFWVAFVWLGFKAYHRWAADDAPGESYMLCISTIGPVDRNGHGNAVAQVRGPGCP